VGRRNVGYTGHLEDEETGLISMVGRMYSPQLGRFLTSDPFVQDALNTQSHNRYSYVWNNPVTMTDPTGFAAIGAEDAAPVVYPESAFEPERVEVVRPVQPADAKADTAASTDAPPPKGPEAGEPEGRRDPVFNERPRVKPQAPSGLWDGYREWIRRANTAVSQAGHRAGDVVQDVTGSATLAATVATNVHLLGGIPVGLAGLGLLPEQLIDSIDVFDDGLEQLAVGVEQRNPYVAARGGAQLAGVVGMWAGTAAGAASVVKAAAPSALAATTRRAGGGSAKAGAPRGGVYALKDEAGQVVRTGRTKDLGRRAGDHARAPGTSEFRFEELYRTDNYATQRGLEQMVHEQFKPPLNRIRPISPLNPRGPGYLDAAQRFLDSLQGGGAP
jgi:RHS repeat-associated protein